MFGFFVHKACGILAPDQGLNPHPLIERWSLNHWTTREVLSIMYFDKIFVFLSFP